MGIFQLIRSDYRKVRSYGASPLGVIFLTQGFWACFQYRMAHGWYSSRLPGIVKKPVQLLFLIWQKMIEITTGISLPASCRIGHSLYIGHFGPVILNGRVVMGHNCNLSQGVTIGVSGRGEKRGTPIIGNDVYIGPNAVIAGPITVGDNAVIGALTLVVQDVPERAVVSGVPATIVSYGGSAGYV